LARRNIKLAAATIKETTEIPEEFELEVDLALAKAMIQLMLLLKIFNKEYLDEKRKELDEFNTTTNGG
jgi:hypothetical protein